MECFWYTGQCFQITCHANLNLFTPKPEAVQVMLDQRTGQDLTPHEPAALAITALSTSIITVAARKAHAGITTMQVTWGSDSRSEWGETGVMKPCLIGSPQAS